MTALAITGCRGVQPSAGLDAGQTALRAADFLSSLGANAAISRRGERLDQTARAVRYLGLRWIRTGYEGGIPVQDLLDLHRRTGVLFSYGLLSGGADLERLLSGGRILAQSNALLAFEGPNEPNNWPVTYGGKQGGGNGSWLPLARLQRDLYRSVKNDALLSNIPVWSISENGAQTDNAGLQFLTIPDGAGTLMPAGTHYADYANCHNYLFHPAAPGLRDNQSWNVADPSPACQVDGLYGNYGRTWRAHFRGYTLADLENLPRVTTETGAVVNAELTEEKQGKLILNLFLAQFKRGWRYTALYLLRDRTDESGNQQFGFYAPGYRPRRAADYLHNLTTILNDRDQPFRPMSLAYTIPEQPATVHDLLLQKKDGSFFLVLWDERVQESDRIQVMFSRRQKFRLYDPTQGIDPLGPWSQGTQVVLTLSDHPVILELDR